MGKFCIRIVFAYDLPLMLAGIEHVAGSACAIELVGTYRTPDELIASFGSVECDVVLIDYSIRGDAHTDGFALFEWLRRTRPNVGVVVLVGDENPVIFRSILERGGASIVSKFDEVGHIVTAIHSTYSGGQYLSPLVWRALGPAGEPQRPPVKLSSRELEGIRLYLGRRCRFKTIAQAAEQGQADGQRAEDQRDERKLGANNDVELVQRAAGLGHRTPARPCRCATAPHERAGRSGAGQQRAARRACRIVERQAGSTKRVTASRSDSA
ncbi:Response regulator [Burkholderia dolosa AU0158]|nr:Response regulator [Burkholderia dolosa AU0158]